MTIRLPAKRCNSRVSATAMASPIADYLSVIDAERTLLNLQEQLLTGQILTVMRLID